MKKYIILSISFLLFSCSKDNNNTISYVDLSDFKEVVKPKPNRINGIEQLAPSSIFLIDSLLLISDYSQNPRLHFYNKKTMQKVGEYGFIGNGPNEFHEPECNGQLIRKDNSKDSFIMIYEFGYGLIHEINLNSILRKETSTKPNKYYLNPEVYNADNVYFINDTVFGEATDNKKVKYFKSSLKNPSKYISLGTVNNNDFLAKVPISEKVNLDRSFMGYSKDNNKFVAGYLRYNKIKFLSNNLDDEKTIVYGSSENKIEKIDFSSPENIFYFKRPYLGKNHFYIPYIGTKNSISTAPKEIHVFDYTGKPIKRYVFDTPVQSFTIDEENKKIYIITGLDEKPYLQYDL